MMKKKWVVLQAAFATATLLGLCAYFWETSGLEMATNNWYFHVVMLICVVVFAMIRWYISTSVALGSFFWLLTLHILDKARLPYVPYIGVPLTAILTFAVGVFVVALRNHQIAPINKNTSGLDVNFLFWRFTYIVSVVALVISVLGIFTLSLYGLNDFYGHIK